jgi:cytochrome c
MKYLFIIVFFITISCGEKKQDQTETTTEIENQSSEASQLKKGADLIASNDCLACHNNDDKIVGPSYKEVAAKYSTTDEAMLAQTIIEGGSGKWGDVPMTAHPTLSEEDATDMVRYILSLK